MANGSDAISKEFHGISNLLHKISTQSGMARYQLEKKGFDIERLDEEKENLLRLLREIEQCALKTGEALRNLRKTLSLSKETT